MKSAIIPMLTDKEARTKRDKSLTELEYASGFADVCAYLSKRIEDKADCFFACKKVWRAIVCTHMFSTKMAKQRFAKEWDVKHLPLGEEEERATAFEVYSYLMDGTPLWEAEEENEEETPGEETGSVQ